MNGQYPRTLPRDKYKESFFITGKKDTNHKYIDLTALKKKILHPFYFFVQNRYLEKDKIGMIIQLNELYFFGIFSQLTTLITYPMYRIFFEFSYQRVAKTFSKYSQPEYTQIKNLIRKGNGYYAGYSSYFVGYMITQTGSFFNYIFNSRCSPIYFFFCHAFSLVISYPFLLNSNYAAVKSPYYIPLHKMRLYLNIYRHREMYIGLSDFIRCCTLSMIPFLNLYAYKLEKFRIISVAGHLTGFHPNNDIEIRKILSWKEIDNSGKFYYNLFPIAYNIHFMFQLVLLLVFYDIGPKYIKFDRKSEAEVYKDALLIKYPYKYPERYVLDHDLIYKDTLKRHENRRDEGLGYNFDDFGR